MRHVLIAFVLSCTVLLSGCATDKRSDRLTQTLNAYANQIRWGDFPGATKYFDPDYAAAHPLTPIERSRFEQYRVSEYDDSQGPMPAGPNDVRQVVRINIVNIHTQTERSLIDRQNWHYDEKTNHWWLTTGLPDIAPKD